MLLLQEFDLEIREKKGAENLAADHLSRLDNPHLEKLKEEEISDKFPEESLFAIHVVEDQEIPWFADIANYLMRRVLPQDLDSY